MRIANEPAEGGGKVVSIICFAGRTTDQFLSSAPERFNFEPVWFLRT